MSSYTLAVTNKDQMANTVPPKKRSRIWFEPRQSSRVVRDESGWAIDPRSTDTKDAPTPSSEMLLYQTEDNRTRGQFRFEGDLPVIQAERAASEVA